MNILDKFHFKDKKTGITTTMEICDSFSRSKIAQILGMIPTKTSQLQNDSGFTTFSGNYNDLTNKPTIPTKTSQLQNDSGFSTFSGNYNDLTNKPTIPTKTSQLQNDSNYVSRFDFGNNAEKILMAKDTEWHFGIVMPNGDMGQLYFNDTGIGLATFDANTQQWVVKWFK